jgi:ribonuclease HII
VEVAAKKSTRKNDGEAMIRLEHLLWDLGFRLVAGVDEAGLGPLAGPVVAGAVVFPADASPIPGVDDSKKLTASRRDELDRAIRDGCLAAACGIVEVEEIDRIGVHNAGLEAMRRAVEGLAVAPEYLLVDARRVPGVAMGQSSYIKADSFIYSVSAASILAKVHRDRLMREMEVRFPGYGFGQHMGYGTTAHMAALERLGPCPIHRRSFEPVRRLLG